ncbi:hypothetical protein CA54_34090 [Symmachiella macrocystis]|uniref:Uncharacterized protein n=1 Tax=Symmachiella macrocystis TaxID=2527985 RepID=A0A5C6BQM5_9PLAN|nr:hypothetical protein CA54_34090 [Symmachiella macrocystis]
MTGNKKRRYPQVVSERDGDATTTRCYRIDRQHLWFGICQTIYCGAIALVCYYVAFVGTIIPDSNAGGLRLFSAIFWSCSIAIGLFQVLSYIRDRLILSPDSIAKRAWTGKTSSIQNVDVLRLIWNESGKRRIRLQTATATLTINFYEYPIRDGKEIIAHVRRQFPAEIQQGWDIFCRSEPQRNRSPQYLIRITTAAAALLFFATAILSSLYAFGQQTVFSLLVGFLCGTVGQLLLMRVFPVIDGSKSIMKSQGDEDITVQEDTRTFRSDQSNFIKGLIIVVLCSVIGIFSTVSAIFEMLDSEPGSIGALISMAFIWGGAVVGGIFVIISSVRARLYLSKTGIVQQGCIGRESMRSDDVSRVQWGVRAARNVFISGVTGEIQINVDGYQQFEQDEIIDFIRNMFPTEIQENWQTYSQREIRRKEWEARRREPEQPSQKKAIACALIFFVVAAAFAAAGLWGVGAPAFGVAAFCGVGGMWYGWRIWKRWRMKSQ